MAEPRLASPPPTASGSVGKMSVDRLLSPAPLGEPLIASPEEVFGLPPLAVNGQEEGESNPTTDMHIVSTPSSASINGNGTSNGHDSMTNDSQQNGEEEGIQEAQHEDNGNEEGITPERPRRGRRKKELSDMVLIDEVYGRRATRKRKEEAECERIESEEKRKRAVVAPPEPHTLPYNLATPLGLLHDYPQFIQGILGVTESAPTARTTAATTTSSSTTPTTTTTAPEDGEAEASELTTEESTMNGMEIVPPSAPDSPPRSLAWETGCPLDGLAGFRSIIDKALEREGKRDCLYWENDHERWTKATYINSDVRYLNLQALGKYDVVLIDPPWRIRGNEVTSDGKTMFNNSKFALEYNTLSNQEIIDIDIGSLSDNGFIFMWIINSQLQFAFECMNKWGYTYADKITWVKKTKKNNISIAQGYYFLHSTEMCLIGIKGKCEYISKVSNDVIFAETREKSQKPDQMYQIIERMVPGGRKIEVFARNHNLRKGWLSLGNELGEYYDWGRDKISCDVCAKVIEIGKPRYKAKQQANRDLCEPCLKASGEPMEDYFFIENIADTMIFHQYYECNGCKTKPLWGMRFHCTDCEDCDLCEACFDAKTIPAESTHLTTHNFQVFEMPELAGGLPVHRDRCAGCLTFPIIGYRFKCHDCPYVNLCQKCFFNKKTPRNHELDHDTELIIDPVDSALIPAKCDGCNMNPILGNRYKCNSCYNYDLCEKCYVNKAPPPLNDLSHKPNHKFTCISATAS